MFRSLVVLTSIVFVEKIDISLVVASITIDILELLAYMEMEALSAIRVIFDSALTTMSFPTVATRLLPVVTYMLLFAVDLISLDAVSKIS